MKREILCQTCHKALPDIHPEDAANGMERRVVEMRVKKPAKHGLTVDGVFHPLSSLRCDHCGQAINDGATVAAVTSWFNHRESEPRMWEEEFLDREA